jgi:hypothetical protein
MATAICRGSESIKPGELEWRHNFAMLALRKSGFIEFTILKKSSQPATDDFFCCDCLLL